MRSRHFFAVLALVLGGLTSSLATSAFAQTGKAPMGEAVAAIVNDEVISTYDVRQRMLLIIVGSGLEMNAEVVSQVQDEAVRALIEERLQLQEARKYKITVEDKEVEAAIEDAAKESGLTAAELYKQLGAQGILPETLRAQFRASLVWETLVQGRYGRRVRVSPDVVSATIARLEANIGRPQYSVMEIFLEAELDSDIAEAVARANSLIDQMQRGAPFNLVAQQFSQSPTAANGGDLGWVMAGELRPEIEAALAGLSKGAVSEPIVTPVGVYVVALRERREGGTGVPKYTLSQIGIAAPSDMSGALAKLDKARSKLTKCEGAASVVKGVSGATYVELGELGEGDLTPEIAAKLAPLKAGQTTAAFSDGGDAKMFLICDRVLEAPGIPDRKSIENRLYSQELARVARRYLRDLRREATIIVR